MNETKSVEISRIVIDENFMMRESLDKELVVEYKENLESMPPITLYDTLQGLLLVDGFHRVAAAKQLSWERINAEIVKGSIQDAFGAACVANLRHGKPLRPKEKKHAVCEYIKLNSKLSNVRIADDVGVNEKTIRNYREELIKSGELKSDAERIGKDNRVIDTSNIGTSEISEVDPFDAWFDERVINGDVFDILNQDSLKYDLIIVDPPYGITKEQWDNFSAKNSGYKNESQTKFELLTFTRRWLNLVLQKLKPTGRLFIFWSREYLFELKPLFDEIKNEYPLNFGGLIVWNFRNTLTVPNNRKELKITWEPIFYFYGLDAPELNRPDTELTGKKWDGIDSDVWTFAIPQSNFNDKRVHPTQKPLDLYKHIIQLTTKSNDSILDPFAGSGTTGHAAYELMRNFRLVEQNPEYVNLIKQRLRGIFKNAQN